jgi:hypothetical protein
MVLGLKGGGGGGTFSTLSFLLVPPVKRVAVYRVKQFNYLALATLTSTHTC